VRQGNQAERQRIIPGVARRASVPCRIHAALTDNGIQFADLPKNCARPMAMLGGHIFGLACRTARDRAPPDETGPPVDEQIGSLALRETGVELSWFADVRMRLYCSQGEYCLRISPMSFIGWSTLACCLGFSALTSHSSRFSNFFIPSLPGDDSTATSSMVWLMRLP